MDKDINNAQISREEQDELMITEAFEKLLESYLSSNHRKKVDLITKAFNFAKQAHKGVRRLSGEPYIMHPIAVAMIASHEMGLGSTSICSALLHDIVEDTDYTTEDLENIFGRKIATIVDGLTKISGGIFGGQASAQAENFKKLLLTMNDDIRVILIKMCDRLHNMRTLKSQPANKQYKIAGETLYIYAPLAHRLGLNKMKTELEDLSFKYEHPEEYAAIEKKLSMTQETRDILFKKFTTPIRKELDKTNLDYEIKARVKTPYSIWSKMQNKNVPFEEVYDILAVRIIFNPKEGEDEANLCFNVYVALNKLYKSHPERFRDWINHPKANGYQALHVTLMSNQGYWIEVQIRSRKMDDIAEQGFAAHWKYKDGNEKQEVDENELNDWLFTIKEILDDPQPDAMDFLDTIKLNLFASDIFVFTPKGEIKTMPAGCTVLDFAFQIHTMLGSHCIGAKVNHRLVPVSHKLNSGDQVEIITSSSQTVQQSWINFVSTAKARAKIQSILRKDSKEAQKQGEIILIDFLSKYSLEINSQILNKLCNIFGYSSSEDLLENLGNNNIILNENHIESLLVKKKENNNSWRKFVPFIKQSNSVSNEDEQQKQQNLIIVDSYFDKKKPIIINEQTIKQLQFKDCCHPIPGDDILGFITNENTIEIHKRACSVAARLKTGYGNRILDAKWDMHKQLFFNATIKIKGIDRIGMLKDIAEVISFGLNVNMHKIVLENNNGVFRGSIELFVHDIEDVYSIIKNLNTVEGLKVIRHIM